MRNESALWHVFSGLVGPRAHLTRIESHATSIGQPDVNYCIDGIEGNVELKYTNSAKKGIILRPSQHQWFRRRVHAGGHPWVLVWVDIPVDDPYYLMVAGHAVVDQRLVQNKSIDSWLLAGVKLDELTIDAVTTMMKTGEYNG